MTPHAAKAKGRALQQAVRDKLLEVFPSLHRDDVRSTAMGQTGEDIQLSPAARRLFPYQIECKNKATSQVHTWYEQAASHGEHTPLLVVKRDRGATLAVVTLDHFLELTKDKYNANS
jgi:hypothetical protein